MTLNESFHSFKCRLSSSVLLAMVTRFIVFFNCYSLLFLCISSIIYIEDFCIPILFLTDPQFLKDRTFLRTYTRNYVSSVLCFEKCHSRHTPQSNISEASITTRISTWIPLHPCTLRRIPTLADKLSFIMWVLCSSSPVCVFIGQAFQGFKFHFRMFDYTSRLVFAAVHMISRVWQ